MVKFMYDCLCEINIFKYMIDFELCSQSGVQNAKNIENWGAAII